MVARSQVPLSNCRGLIAGLSQYVRHGHGCGIKAPPETLDDLDVCVEFETKSLLVLPGQQSGTRRAARCRRYISIGELHTAGHQRVDMRRRYLSRTEAADVRVAEIITEDHDEVEAEYSR